MGKVIDLTGRRFGKLTVIKRAYDYIRPSGQHEIQWLCQCDCGNTMVVHRSSLLSGDTKSCGCLRNELSSKRTKKYNTYNLDGKFGTGYTLNGDVFYFDLEDYDKIKDYCWRKADNGYIITTDYNKLKTTIIQLHRLVLNFPDSKYDIDHIKGRQSRFDNRKSNLRICTHSQNMMNANIRTDNVSGATGVSWYKKSKKWEAYIQVQNKKIYLGLFDSFDDAVTARKQAEEKYFGEYSYDNSQTF